MIVCPNCNHQNPDGATQCEACYTPLPETTSCTNCGATVQADAGFCGQCGFNLKANSSTAQGQTSSANPLPDVPDLITPEPLIEPEFMPMTSQMPDSEQNPPSTGDPDSESGLPPTIVSKPSESEAESVASNPDLATTPPPPPTIASTPVTLPEETSRGRRGSSG